MPFAASIRSMIFTAECTAGPPQQRAITAGPEQSRGERPNDFLELRRASRAATDPNAKRRRQPELSEVRRPYVGQSREQAQPQSAGLQMPEPQLRRRALARAAARSGFVDRC